jgi:hypothetical protein
MKFREEAVSKSNKDKVFWKIEFKDNKNAHLISTSPLVNSDNSWLLKQLSTIFGII